MIVSIYAKVSNNLFLNKGEQGALQANCELFDGVSGDLSYLLLRE
jgi:hypothetical protein